MTEKLKPLGYLEELVLLATLHLRNDAYGVSIQNALEDKSGLCASTATVYVTLKRLEKKGFTTSRFQQSVHYHGRPISTYYEVTKEGEAALAASEAARNALRSSLHQKTGVEIRS